MRETALILISHGEMAQAALNSAEMIVGNIEGAHAISLKNHDVVEDLKEKLREVMEKLSDYKNLIVLVDIIGGTPCNVAVTEIFNRKNVKIISGFNLAMILEFATAREEIVDELADRIIRAGKDQIKDLKVELMGVAM